MGNAYYLQMVWELLDDLVLVEIPQLKSSFVQCIQVMRMLLRFHLCATK
jgi:hypothetical protein